MSSLVSNYFSLCTAPMMRRYATQEHSPHWKLLWTEAMWLEQTAKSFLARTPRHVCLNIGFNFEICVELHGCRPTLSNFGYLLVRVASHGTLKIWSSSGWKTRE